MKEKRAFLIYNNATDSKNEFRSSLNNVFIMYMIYQLRKHFNETDIILYGINGSFNDMYSTLHDKTHVIHENVIRMNKDNIFIDRCFYFYNQTVKKYDYIVNIDSDMTFKDINACYQVFCSKPKMFNGYKYTNKNGHNCILATVNIANIKNVNSHISYEGMQKIVDDHLKLIKSNNTHVYDFNNEEKIYGDAFYNESDDLQISLDKFANHYCWISSSDCYENKMKLFKLICNDNEFMNWLIKLDMYFLFCEYAKFPFVRYGRLNKKIMSLGCNCSLNHMLLHMVPNYPEYAFILLKTGSLCDEHLAFINSVFEDINKIVDNSSLLKVGDDLCTCVLNHEDKKYCFHIEGIDGDPYCINNIQKYMLKKADFNTLSNIDIFIYWQWQNDTTFTNDNLRKFIGHLRERCKKDFLLYLILTNDNIDVDSLLSEYLNIRCFKYNENIAYDYLKYKFNIRYKDFHLLMSIFIDTIDIEYVRKNINSIIRSNDKRKALKFLNIYEQNKQ